MIAGWMGKRRLPTLSFLFLVLLLLGACGNVPAPATVEATSLPAPAVAYVTVEPRTATPTPVATTPRPTPTWVPLITPSATPGEKVPAKRDVPRIGVGDARAMAEAGEAVFVDVRGDAIYALAHIPGALSLPAGEVALRYEELPAGKLAIFYCA